MAEKDRKKSTLMHHAGKKMSASEKQKSRTNLKKSISDDSAWIPQGSSLSSVKKHRESMMKKRSK